jgi:hypothetical protein
MRKTGQNPLNVRARSVKTGSVVRFLAHSYGLGEGTDGAPQIEAFSCKSPRSFLIRLCGDRHFPHEIWCRPVG